MSYWQFWRMLFGNAWERAFESSHRVYFYRFLFVQAFAIAAPIAKAIGWLPIPHLEESTLISIPILVFVGFLFWAITHEAYRAFRYEQEKRSVAERQVTSEVAKANDAGALELTRVRSQLEEAQNELAEMRKPKFKVEPLDEPEDTGDRLWHCRVRVTNIGMVTVRKCGAILDAIQPKHVNTPIPLQWSQEPTPGTAKIDINAGISRVFDVCRTYENSGTIAITGAWHQPGMPKQEYAITIQIHGDGVPPESLEVIVKPQDGKIHLF